MPLLKLTKEQVLPEGWTNDAKVAAGLQVAPYQPANPQPQGTIKATGTPTDMALFNKTGMAPAPPPPAQPLDGRSLQNLLNSMGAGLKVDGIIGPMTRAAMAKYGVDQFGKVTTPQAAPPPDSSPQNAPMPSYDLPGIDVSGAMQALQGAVRPYQAPTSILDQLLAQLGPAPQIPNVDINKTANDQINAQYLTKENALAQQLQGLTNTYNQGVTEQNTYGQKADASLQQIFNALAGQLGQDKQQVAGIYGQAQSDTGKSFDTADQRLAGIKDSITQQLQQSLGGLGIEQAMPGPLARILENYGNHASQMVNNRAISQDALSRGSANQQSLLQDMIASGQRQGATARSDVATGVQGALAQLGLQNAQGQADIGNQRSLMGQQKGLDLQNAIAALTQQQYNQQRQAQQDRLSQLTGLGNLDLGQQRIEQDAQQSYNQQNMSLAEAMANLDLQAQKGNQDAAAQLAKLQNDYQTNQMTLQAKYSNPLDDALKAAQLQNLTTRTDLLTNPLPKGPTYNQALQDYLNAPEDQLWGAGGAGPNFRSAITALIGGAEQAQNSNPKLDPYQQAVSQVPVQEGVTKYGLNQSGILEALRRYYTGK